MIHIQLLEELLRLAQANGSFDDWRLRQQLAQAATEVRLFQLHNWRSLTRLSKGEAPGPEGSALKLYWSEMSKRLHETAHGRARAPPRRCGRARRAIPADGAWQRSWLYYQASSIFAGTQRDPAHDRRRAGARPAPGLSELPERRGARRDRMATQEDDRDGTELRDDPLRDRRRRRHHHHEPARAWPTPRTPR